MQAELIETGGLARSIEAVLFVASEALSIKSLAKLTGASEADVSLALARIDAEYADRGIVLREIAGGYRFASAPAARSAVEAYLRPPKTNLSPAALETLAIVAYMQPVTKGDIEGIRGVSADSVLSTLVDRRFLAEAGRKDVAGRPILYRTTTEFLESFGLRSLEELPPIDVDATTPIELALPIETRAVPATAEENLEAGEVNLEVRLTSGEIASGEDRSSANDAAKAEEAVGAARSDDSLGTAQSGDSVGAAQSDDFVGAARSDDAVGAAQSGDAVGAAQSGDAVGAAQSKDSVGAAQSKDSVGTARSDDSVGAARFDDSAGPTWPDEPATVTAVVDESEKLSLP